ncbi:probable carboxylesterase 15 [Olea europaea subsp. europaea]|uniref:Probable carboxylesterase 15 n=1 Tax=Olea europaea subsp. europaea TaxID=158383 RepID=A0A8S0V484_OLEEU|nr:probable carboxylesterase 15 [Olea europaea subsp. europaea]
MANSLDDGSVYRARTGPLEFKFMVDRVLPHEDFVDGITIKDVVTVANSDQKVQIYLPEKNIEDFDKLPLLLQFHGGGFCINQADWYMYHTIFTSLARTNRAIVVSVADRAGHENLSPLKLGCTNPPRHRLFTMEQIGVGAKRNHPF